MIVFPNAKINIGLFITEKRSDGYHNIESCFYPVGWQDVLEILPSNELTFTQTGIALPDNAENLCIKAYKLLHATHNLPSVSIHLHKNIPIGAGLGGGSADAAFTIKALNNLFSLNLSVDDQKKLAANLGSDCSFFIENTPKYCFDKGDKMQDLALDLAGKYIVIIYPNLFISTKEAYSEISPNKALIPLSEYLLENSIDKWSRAVHNNFEDPLFIKYPVLLELKNQLYNQGAAYASMSGSGSAVYGIFKKETSLELPTNYKKWEGYL